MKSLIIILGLLVIVQSGPYKQRCSNDAACEACALSWFCEYGNSEDMKEECYENCMKYKIDYDQHADVQKAKETTVHEKPALVETKAKINQTPEKDRCMKNPACEGCALSWQCEYGQKPELVEECYKNCFENKIKYDLHSAVREAEEVDVHK